MKAEESLLWENYRKTKSTELKEKLIKKYAPFVKYIAGRVLVHLPQNVDLDDLIGYGILGLLDAIEKFDHTKGVKFETYAYSRIKGAIYDGIRESDWIPKNVREELKRVEKKYVFLQQKLGRDPKDDELCKALNITKKKLYELYNIPLIKMLSFTNLGDFDTLKQFVASNDYNPEKFLETNEIKTELGKAIDKLPYKEKMVITLYYYEGLTQREISEVLNISESRVSQLHAKGILRLRGSLGRKKQLLI